MKTIIGEYAQALIYTDLVEDSALEQIKTICDQPFTENCRIRIMPDVHSGSGCVIGFTADLGQLLIPNIVGVDIGCGMLTVELGNTKIDYEELDRIIREKIPTGMNVYDESVVEFPKLQELYCYNELKNLGWIKASIGSLGGGNHFIEVDVDDTGHHYLVIHTGSRNLGKQVAEYYQQLAYDTLCGKYHQQERREQLIAEYKAAGREHELSEALRNFNSQVEGNKIPKELCYLTGQNRDAYLHDMKICQEFAIENRRTIADRILFSLTGKMLDDYAWFQTVHNYIDHESNIIRKGAVSAKKGEKLLIPINMRDGSLICVGKGNEEWNYSAPHGAGRLFSRSAARKTFSLEDYSAAMDGIFTTSVSVDTIDECPMAYKPIDAILENITSTVEVVGIIRPIFNFKAGE